MSKYVQGDHVVILNEGRYEIGLVTNVRKKKNAIVGYDIRTERGSGLPLVTVSKSRTGTYIDPQMTQMWLDNGGFTHMYVDKNLGHTRANYSSHVQMRLDGDDGKVGHFEKYNDLIFPTIGARSY